MIFEFYERRIKHLIECYDDRINQLMKCYDNHIKTVKYKTFLRTFYKIKEELYDYMGDNNSIEWATIEKVFNKILKENEVDK